MTNIHKNACQCVNNKHGIQKKKSNKHGQERNVTYINKFWKHKEEEEQV
jgi:hypothetical protein